MRKIVTGAFVSLDGVMQAPGGPDEDPTGGFRFGGWATPWWDDATGTAMDELFAEPYDLLLGRRTYDIFAAHWPFVAPDPAAGDLDRLNADIASTFNRITKYVATRRPESLTWRNSEALGPDPVARLRTLKTGAGPRLVTQGSTELVAQLLAADLIDELLILTFPVVLGSGKRLFHGGAAPGAFRLAASSAGGSGVTIALYERTGEVPVGSFAIEPPTEAELRRRASLEQG